MPDAKTPETNGTKVRVRKGQSGAVANDHLDAQFDNLAEDDQIEVIPDTDADTLLAADDDELEAISAAKKAAERRAEVAERRVADQNKELLESRTQIVNSMIAAEEGKKADIKTRMKLAKDAGDFDAETEATDELQQANVRINDLNRGKTEIERAVEREKDRPADAVEAYVSEMAPRAQSWIRSHPEVVTNRTKNAELVTAHFHAIDGGLKEGTDEYYMAVEAELGYRAKPQRRAADPEQDDDEPQRQQQARRRENNNPPAARPSREVPEADLPRGVSRTGDGRYRLDGRHREAAQMAGVSESAYLKEMLNLKRTGEIQ